MSIEKVNSVILSQKPDISITSSEEKILSHGK